MQWAVAARALALGLNVILDFGLWTRAEREDFRERAAAIGARNHVHGLAVPKEELWARLEKRNADLPPHTFRITREQLDSWWAIYQPLYAQELSVRRAPGEP